MRSMNQLNNKSKIDKNTINRLMVFFKKYKFKFIVVIISIIISALSQVIMQTFIKTLIDEYIEPLLGIENPIFTPLVKAIMMVGFVCLLGIIAAYTYTSLMVKISQGILKDIRQKMFDHMQTLPIKYFDENTNGDIMSHYTNDTDALRQMISQSIPQFISSSVTIIGTFVAMLYLNIYLTFIVLLGVLLMLLVTKKIASRSGKYFMLQQESIADLNGYIEEMVVGAKVVKVFTHEEFVKKDFDILNEKLCNSSTKAHTYANTLMPIMGNLGYLIYVIVAISGALIATSGLGIITLGTIAAFLTLTRSFTNPVSQISQQLNSIVMALAGAKRIFNLLDLESETNDGKVILVNVEMVNGLPKETNTFTGYWAWKKTDGSLVPLKGHVQFKNVTFSYKKEKIVLNNVSLDASPGTKIAFVGSTGAGKTTITNLINRFYEIKKGNILYDGIDISEIDKNSLRLSLGMVLQDTNLFTGTILENIKYGNMNATIEDCISAAKLANAHKFISNLEDEYNTVITENGASLSQGERQLLTIARSAVANPPVMILDEATSSIDTRTEKIVQEGMDKLMENRTTFVIAHRLSTIKNADVIMVIEQGKIIEQGNHQELLKLKGRYYQLYTGKAILE